MSVLLHSLISCGVCFCFFFSSRRRHTRLVSDWSSRRVLFRSICGNKPAKLLDFESLTLKLGSSRFWPVYLIFSGVWWCEGDFAPGMQGAYARTDSPHSVLQSRED